MKLFIKYFSASCLKLLIEILILRANTSTILSDSKVVAFPDFIVRMVACRKPAVSYTGNICPY